MIATESAFGPPNDLAAHRANNTAEDILYNIDHWLDLSDSDDPEDHDTAADIERLLKEKLTKRQANAIFYYCCLAFTLTETAEVMHCSTQNVSQIVRAAMTALKKAIEDDKTQAS